MLGLYEDGKKEPQENLIAIVLLKINVNNLVHLHQRNDSKTALFQVHLWLKTE